MCTIIPNHGGFRIFVDTTILQVDMRKVFLIGLLQFWFVQVAFPQNDHYSIRNYSAVDGLPQSQVMGLAEDANGYLWLGTRGGGIARFDGREFKVYTKLDGLLSNDVDGVFLDKHQNLWIRHEKGVTRFDGVQFKTFVIPGDPLHVVKDIKKIYESNDTIFLLSSIGGFTKIYRDSIYYRKQLFQDNQKIKWIHTAPGGDLCFFMSDGSCFVRTNNEMVQILTSNNKPQEFVTSFNYKGRVMVKTYEGLFELNLQQKTLQKVAWDVSDETYILLYDDKRDFFWTKNGNILFKERLRNNTIERDTVLKDISVQEILIDSEENTWFATDGGGLYKYFIQDFERISPPNLKGVMTITKDQDGFLWTGTMTNGIWRMKDGKVKSYTEKNKWRNVIRALRISPDGTLWAASVYGLGKYDKHTDSFKWYTKEDGLIGNSILTLDFDDKGGLWIGTQGGLSYFDGKIFQNYDPKKLPNNNFRYSTFFSKKYQTLFIGTDIGLTVIKDGIARAIPMPALNSIITSVQPYQDSLLVLGTGGNGVIIFNPRTKTNHFITTREGLASDFAYFVNEDEKHYLWVGTEKGINRIRLNPATDVIENLHYGYDNGLTGVETNQNAFYFHRKEKYFGLVDGLYVFNDFDSRGKKSFNLHLTDVQILYGEYPASAYTDSLYGFFKIPYKPFLPPDKNHVTFHFNRVDKRYPKSVKFKYFLENFDKAWSPPSSAGQVTYGNLPPGEYLFRVMATDNQGSWADLKIVYPFTVRAPFYQRTSFILGMLIMVAGIITLTLYIRVKQRIRKVVEVERIRVKEQENLRKEIAQDFHDEMGNHLTRIINYISLLKLNGSNGNHLSKQNELYGKVEESAKYLYTGTRDFIWGIDPVNDELSKLFIHIRDFGEKLFEEKSISFRAFNEVKEKIKLPYGFSREANLIFKEAMTNAFKYSEAANVTFSLHQEGEGFQLILHDDGKGFYCGEIESSNGLKNIRERAGKINAVLRITSGKDQGTRITLNFKHTKKLNYGAAV